MEESKVVVNTVYNSALRILFDGQFNVHPL